MTNHDSPGDGDWLLEETGSAAGPASAGSPWTVLVVDDQQDVHDVTRLALRGFEYHGRPLRLLAARSVAEAFDLLSAHPEIALVLLDVVMETEDAGLKLVWLIREALGYTATRIVLRTGQPGHAPEKQVVLNYDINDYRLKTELTADKLFTVVVSALRTYETLSAIERCRLGLGDILRGAIGKQQPESRRLFASGVLAQICALLAPGTQGLLCGRKASTAAAPHLLAATPLFSSLDQEGRFRAGCEPFDQLLRAFHDSACRNDSLLYFAAPDDREFMLHLAPGRNLLPHERLLMDAFCSYVSSAFQSF